MEHAFKKNLKSFLALLFKLAPVLITAVLRETNGMLNGQSTSEKD